MPRLGLEHGPVPEDRLEAAFWELTWQFCRIQSQQHLAAVGELRLDFLIEAGGHQNIGRIRRNLGGIDEDVPVVFESGVLDANDQTVHLDWKF